MSEQISVSDNRKSIGGLFDRIAPHYDRLNHLLSLNIDKIWRRKAVKELSQTEGTILDVATGTCDFAIEILRAKKTKKLIGVDLSEVMMALGRKKIEQFISSKDIYKDCKVDIKAANCADLPFEDNTFAAVTCCYGVRNFSKLEKCLQEMHRVMQENGKLVIVEFSYPSNKLVRIIYDFYFTKILPTIGKMISKDNSAYNYLPASVKAFYKGKQFADKLSEAGFRNTNWHNQTFGISTIYTAIK